MGSPMAVAAEAGPDRFWDTYSRYYDSIYRLFAYREMLWDVFTSLELEPGMRVLDAGCGTGNFEHFIAEKTHPAIRIEAVDFSTSMLARAREKCADLDYVSFTQADLNARLPFEDATFDRIVSVNVLYALEDQAATVREWLRMLRPGGTVVIANPTPEYSWGPLAADHFRRIPNIWGFSRKVKTIASSVATMSTSAVGSFVLNALVINKREERGEYHSMTRDEFTELLEHRRLDGVGSFRVEPTMARQGLLATASKVLVA